MDQSFVVAGKYRVRSLIGKGGMSAVYDAVHRVTGRRVALKLLREDQLHGVGIERFVREARIIGGISSPHVVAVLDAGKDDESGIPYLAMEYLEGCDLGSLVRHRGRLPVPLALNIAMQVCRGLAAAHAADIVHRDIKPANVRLTPGSGGELVAKLLDFGVAKDLGDAFVLTRSSDIVGSILYMAPEQFLRKVIDFRVDLWGVGVLLFESLAGSLPKRDGEVASLGVMAAGSRAFEPPDVRTVVPDVPAKVAELITRAMAADPARRFPSALEMAAAIAALLPNREPVMYADAEAGDAAASADAAPTEPMTPHSH